MGIFTNSPLAKYVKSVKEAPKGIYNHQLMLTVIMYALAGMPKGWDEGTTASVTQLKSFQRHFGVTPKNHPEQISNIVSFVNLTAGIGALLSFFLNDRLGRIWSYRLYMAIYALGNIIETFSYGSLPALYVGRLVAGAGIGSLTVVGPMAIVEIAPTTTRGLMTLWFNVCMLSSQMIGIFIVFGCNVHVNPTSRLQYQIPFFVQCFVPAIGVVMSFFLHESPRWLCLRGRTDEALRTLTILRGLPSDHAYLLAEWDMMSTQVAREQSEFGDMSSGSIIRETFCVRSNLRRVQLTIVAYILAQFSGANSVTNYLPEIFGIIGVRSTNVKVYASGLYALAKLVCCLAASLFFVDALGRRKSLFVGITVQMLCHSYLAGYLNFFVRNEDSVTTGASDMAIGVIYIHAFGWAVGLYTLPYLFGAELWPNRIRSFGGALSQGFHWLFYFGITKATPALLNAMNQWGAFVFFVAWCVVALIYSYIMVPETAGRALENMDALFEGPWWAMRKAAKVSGNLGDEENGKGEKGEEMRIEIEGGKKGGV
ncbi:putative transporter [Aaosphaeria arxii CBS 175.79]|uniref:Putative transporter n=1 Tax=Aaosphaeria arxii CBS 175.79 TaxID=1450172 RepID=A0A6A5XFR5_9PLEO|nr:putative transporter [Aaosphaeria arxii CBS 175.79]KAF2011988.1 putative transporter [Aaosphaeria arxii CBS 175.79]